MLPKHLDLEREIEKVPFSPFDWAVALCIGAAILFGLGWVIAEASLSFTVEVPARGGTYTEGIVGVPRFINPVLAISDADRDLVQLVFSGLMRSTAEGSVVPDLAQSYSISDDGKTYTFVLRDGITFHDGSAITAEDVAYTVLLAQNPAIKSPKRANWEGITVTVVDPKTVSFTLKSPYAPFIENTTLGILPKHLWKEVSAEEFPFSTLNSNPVGNGPYKVSSVETTKSGIPSKMYLTAFGGNGRIPFITYLELSFFEDGTALMNALESDATLAAHSILPTNRGGRHINEAVLGRIFAVFYNQNQNDLFADKEVRRALDRALDKNALVDTLVSGYGSAIAGPLPPDSVEKQPESESADIRLDDAKKILEKDGWTIGADGVYEKKVKKGVKKLSFTLVTNNAPELKKAAELVALQWRTLGVQVTTQFFEKNDLQQEIIRPRKYEAILFGEVIGRELDLFAFWHSSQRNDPGLNIGLYVNKAVDKKLEEARVAEDPAVRSAALAQAAQTIEDESAATFLYAPHFVYVTPVGVRGIQLGTITTPSDRFLSITDWFVRTERVWPLFK